MNAARSGPGRAPHILAAVSPHGFGHLAQASTVLAALRAAHPALRVTLRTTLPRDYLATRVAEPFALQPAADDFGMVQRDALAVDVAASAERYRRLHGDWEARVDAVAAELMAVGPDLVFADVPYLTLAAAARARIPAVALCCLNWADIYRHYCGARPEAPPILAQMEAAYRGAQRFLRTAPTMPMPWLDNAVDIGPVMRHGSDRRTELAARLGSGPGEKLVLVAMGGIHLRPTVERWPQLPGVRFIVQQDWGVSRADMVALEGLGMPFSDLLASCDLLLTKPGYGSFTEAAACGVPVLYARREEWPEAPYLEAWLAAHGRCTAISAAALEDGGIAAPLRALLAAGRHAPVAPTGVAEAVAQLEALLFA